MAKNRQIDTIYRKEPQPYKQVVLSAPRKLFKEKYLTKKGKKLMALATTDKQKKVIRSKYEKNRYIINPDCRLFRNANGKTRIIKHT